MKLPEIFHRTKFVNQVLTLLVGTGISQVIQVVTMPVVSRIYSPTDIGIYAIFFSVTSILTIPSAGRYDRAILLPKEESDAIHLTLSSAAIVLGYCVLLFVIITVFGGMLAERFEKQEIKIWLAFIPISVFFLSMYQIFTTFLNRMARYRELARNRVVRAVVMGGVTIGFGMMSMKPMGLVWGAIIGTVIATCLLFVDIARIYRSDRTPISYRRSVDLLKRYRDFPKYSIAAALANGVSMEMPILLLTAFFGPSIVGYYSLASKAIGVPSSLIAYSFGDVFQEWASKEIHARANCSIIWMKTAKYLLFVSTPFFIILFFIAPFAVPFVFGSEWATAGTYMQILIPFYYLAFTASPLSRTLFLMEKQVVDLIWQLNLFAITVITITVGAKLGNAATSIGLYSAAYVVMYLIYLGLSHGAASQVQSAQS
jgi:O-antigen/teichoic acid export membrane protein